MLSYIVIPHIFHNTRKVTKWTTRMWEKWEMINDLEFNHQKDTIPPTKTASFPRLIVSNHTNTTSVVKVRSLPLHCRKCLKIYVLSWQRMAMLGPAHKSPLAWNESKKSDPGSMCCFTVSTCPQQKKIIDPINSQLGTSNRWWETGIGGWRSCIFMYFLWTDFDSEFSSVKSIPFLKPKARKTARQQIWYTTPRLSF